MHLRAAPAAGATGNASSACRHCGQPAFGQAFCCPGCRAAFNVIEGMGLGQYYARRALDPTARVLKPEAEARDYTSWITTDAGGLHQLSLCVDGLQCGACVWLIENILARTEGLQSGRVNMTTRRLTLRWRGEAEEAGRFCAAVEQLGYRLVPFDPGNIAEAGQVASATLTRALAVAGFAAGNVMLISLATWFGATQHMGDATRDLLHWISALIAMPAVAYAGQPFFRSARAALAHGRTNMDVPISIGVVVVTGLSLWQTIAGAGQVYFDSAVTLLFFLLIGRLLDQAARGRARATAEQLLLLRATEITCVLPDGSMRKIPAHQLQEGDCLLVGMGERVAADGTLESAEAQLDTSLVSGESLPQQIAQGGKVFAGTINLGQPMLLRATATGDATLLAECVRLIEAAEAARGRTAVLADRVARYYAPVIHGLALATFLAWFCVLQRPLAPSLLAACAVLIITCPCALALAVPAVQVIATQRLFRAGVLLKSPTALERLASITHVVFDKTGTLTNPVLSLAEGADRESLDIAASLAATSRHPLARALVLAAGGAAPAANAVETPGQGIAAGETRLGSRRFCGLPGAASTSPELCLTRPGHAPVMFSFAQSLRPDAAETLGQLREGQLHLEILSGDQPESVAAIAAALAVPDWQAAQTPPEKLRHIEALRKSGARVLMVGDGLNDGPSLAAADISASPACAADISQTIADLVFQGASLAPLAFAHRVARRAQRVMWENLGLALAYNAIMVPLAMCGVVTPWLAALAMSSSSLLVMANALRLGRMRP